MKIRMTAAALTLLVAAVPALASQHSEKKPDAAATGGMSEADMKAMEAAGKPGPEHEALAKFAGDWTFTNKAWMVPGAPPMESTGTMHAESMWGGRYVVEDWKGDMMGQSFEGRGVNAYNNVAKRYENTWVDSMGTGIWFSTGTCDAAGVCTFNGDGFDPVSGQKMNMRSVISWVDANTFKMQMYGPGPDGKEFQMMEIVAKKK